MQPSGPSARVGGMEVEGGGEGDGQMAGEVGEEEGEEHRREMEERTNQAVMALKAAIKG